MPQSKDIYVKYEKGLFTNKCAARVAGGAPPRHRPRKCSAAAVVARADPTSQVQPTCSPSRRKTCRDPQTFNPHPLHSCPCQARGPGNPVRCHVNIHVNIYMNILINIRVNIYNDYL